MCYILQYILCIHTVDVYTSVHLLAWVFKAELDAGWHLVSGHLQQQSLLGQDKGEKLCRAEGTLIWKSWCGNGLEALLVACIFWRATTLWLHLNATPKEVKEQTTCFASAVPSAFSYSLSCFVTSPCSQQSCWWSCYRLDLYTSHSSCGWWHSVWSKSTAASC